MDETLANLMIVLKTVGLNESKVGLRELEGVLRATGLSVDQLAASLNKSSANLEHVNDLTRAHAQANRDAAMFAQRFATEQEKVLGLFQRLEESRPYLTVDQHARAYDALSASLANAENRFVSLASVQKTAANYSKDIAGRGLRGAVDGDAIGFIGPPNPRLAGSVGIGDFERRAAEFRVEQEIASALRERSDAERKATADRREGWSVAQQYFTQEERIYGQLRRVEELYRDGAITIVTYTRAVTGLKDELNSLRPTASFVARDGGAKGFIGPMQESYGPAKPSDATKVSDAVTRGLEQERRVRAQLVAEKERENVLNLQAMSLLRQLETPEQAHVRRQATYNNLLREGYINQTQFNQAVEQSGHAMRTQQALGTKGGGLAAMQAGYGIQDFATVMAMGGENAFGRAMISASNNLGQMAVVMGALNPMLTAAVATSVTLAAVLGPSLFSHFLSDTDEAASNTEKARDEAEKYATTLRSLKNELDQARFSFAFGQEERIKRQSGASAESDFVGGLLGDQRNDAVTKFQDRAAALRLEREMNAAQRSDLNTRRTNILRPYLGEFADFSKFGFQNATQAQDAIEQGSGKRPMIPGAVLEESAKIDKELFGLSVAFNDLGDSLARLSEAGKNLLKRQTAEEAQKRSEADIREKTAAQQQERANAIRASNSARERVLSMLQATRRAAATPSEAAGMESSTSEQDFVNALAGAKDLSNDERRARLSQFYSSRRDQSRKSLEELQQKPEFAPRFSSASEFGRAFQMTLMKPDSKAEKQRDEMIKYHKEQIARLDKLIDKPSGGMVGN